MIYVFKTSVDTKSKLEFASSLLDELLPNALWNFDLEDCDNILRIDCDSEVNEMVLKNEVFDCVELE
ncbi:hypothetical protein ACHRV1_14540 [Flavobacterium aquidurense]|jgi:hypothetical protein|uniref:hypothetical protein n=1 Tax=Flavobacterium aquidurense TaxID=362413 RepID=UPI00091D4761|nr:hypothetical protein [Flavobacterium aquidurense]OXA71073.1 hypothetical protein B0A67_12415 [Flavobacterium aquidurense]SHG63148.1 hypothetical protein SAMN05444481_10623 [Flavobacterium frigidimaris]